MSEFFAFERAAYAGEKQGLSNVEFKKKDFENSLGSRAGTLLEIIPVHIKNPPVIQFIAYLQSMSDRYNPEFSAQQPFGRPDPYYVWKSSKRSISVSLDIPSSSLAKGLDNLNNLNWLLASTYPTYKDRELANSIAASPLFRVRYSNLIASRTQNGQGILCTLTGVNVVHDLKAGFIMVTGEEAANSIKFGGFDTSTSQLDRLQIPKLIKLTMTLNVIHDHSVGWDFETGEWRGGKFASGYPYGFGLMRDTSDTPGSGVPPAGGNTTSGGATGDMNPDNREQAAIVKRQNQGMTDTTISETVEKTQ